MSRAHSGFIPAEQVEGATGWEFGAVDQAALRFAAKLRAQELEEARQRDSTARQDGYTEGYAAGFAQGHAQATLEGQKQMADFIAQQGQDAARRLGALLDAAGAQLDQAQQTLAQDVLGLACDIARQIVRAELSINPNAAAPVAREALGMLVGDHRAATLRMNPVDADVLAPQLQQEYAHLALTVLPDASIDAGGCLLESAATVVDGTLARRWSRTVAALGLESAWEPDRGGDDAAS